MSEIGISNRFVTFRIEDELYAIDVFKSREIIEVPDITKVPGMTETIRGVINIRGEVLPVLDLKAKFGMRKTEFHQSSAIIVTEIDNTGDVIPIGIIVDEAREVITLEADQIKPPPKIEMFIDDKYIQGIGKIGDRFVMIINVDKILSDEELAFPNEIK